MLTLQDSVSVLKSVGQKRQEALQELGIETIEDLLLHFPFRYADIAIKDVTQILDQDKVTLKGMVLTEPVVSYYGGRKNRLSFKLRSGEHVIGVSFFNQPYLKQHIKQSETVAIYGKWDEKRQVLMGMKIINQADESSNESVYPASKAIKANTLAQLIHQAYQLYEQVIIEILPDELIRKYQLLSYKEAIHAIHFATDLTLVEKARERFIYQELLVYQTRLLQLKQQRKQEKELPVLYQNEALKTYIQTIPFELTAAQKKVSNEICRDLRQDYPMNRLLQGDVGSGKTIVASIGVVASALDGHQSAIMVPTEILAQQHFETFERLLKPLQLSVALLTSSTKPKERDTLLKRLKEKEIDCIIGTHALIQDDVVFKQLGLVIIDEQHRFGVSQRQALKNKATLKNVLYMSATPIPRTLSLSLFGEMDVSVIDELPSGRLEIQTKWVRESEMAKVLAFVKKQVDQGRQAYVITPLIEESMASDLKNAQDVFEQFQQYFNGDITVALLHGKMKPLEKEEIMTQFKRNDIQVLVSTTVIEVGVNVPNATVMVIQDAERFGLAQLHQLRGRVGRGQFQSYCLLVSTPKTESGKLRLKAMTESTDGFYLSQKDMEMRGAGDLFGFKQSGVPKFKLADIVRDAKVLLMAHEDAKMMLQSSAYQNDDIYGRIKRYISTKEVNS